MADEAGDTQAMGTIDRPNAEFAAVERERDAAIAERDEAVEEVRRLTAETQSSGRGRSTGRGYRKTGLLVFMNEGGPVPLSNNTNNTNNIIQGLSEELADCGFACRPVYSYYEYITFCCASLKQNKREVLPADQSGGIGSSSARSLANTRTYVRVKTRPDHEHW